MEKVVTEILGVLGDNGITVGQLDDIFMAVKVSALSNAVVGVTRIPPKEVINADEAAEFLGIDRSTISRLCKSGQIPFFKIGTCYRFRINSLINWMGEQENLNMSKRTVKRRGIRAIN